MLKAADPAFLKQLDSSDRISPAQGVELFLRILANPLPRVVVSIGGLEACRNAPARRPPARRIVSQARPSGEPAPNKGPCNEGPIVETRNIHNTVALALGYEPDQLDPSEALVALGMDSLGATSLRNQIATDYGVDVPIARLVGGMSIQELNAYLEENNKSQGSVETTQAADIPLSIARSNSFGAIKSAGPDQGAVVSSSSRGTNVDEQELYLGQHISEALGYEMHEIDVTASLIVLGLDSLGAVALRNRITTDKGIDVPMAELVGGLSIRELSVFLAEKAQHQSSAEVAQTRDVAPVRFVEGEL